MTFRAEDDFRAKDKIYIYKGVVPNVPHLMFLRYGKILALDFIE